MPIISKKFIRKWEPVIAFIVGMGTLISFFTGGFSYISNLADEWIHRDPDVVIRNQEVWEFDDMTEYLINFSVANRRDEPITLNSIIFRIGDYAYGGPAPFAYIAFKTFSREINLSFVGNANGTSFPIHDTFKSNDSMGNAAFIITYERGLLAPYEQMDISLKIKLHRPTEFRGKYSTVWSLGGQIIIRYEDQSLNERIVRYPKNP